MNYAILIHQSGEWKGKQVSFPEGTITIGRGGGNRLIFDELDHLMVSRQHAEILWTDDAWVLRDLNSTSGTYRNGVETSQAVLSEGDRVRFGEDGPEIQVRFSTADPLGTVVMTDQESASAAGQHNSSRGLKETAVFPSPSMEEPPRMARATVVDPSSVPPEEPIPAKTSGTARVEFPAADFLSPASPVVLPGSQATGFLFHRPPEQMARIMMGIAAVLLLLCLYLMIQVSINQGQLKSQAEKIAKIEEVNAELVRKLSASNPVDVERMFRQKSEEMDQRMERKSREFDQKFNMLLDTNPLMKWRYQQMRKNR